MMLQQLVALAEREGLGDLDFESRPVDYDLGITEDGAFTVLVPIASGEQRRSSLSGLPMGPTSKNNPGFPSFVVDNAQYLLGTAKPFERAGNADKSFASFAALIGQAAADSGDVGLQALQRFLAQPDQRARADAALSEREGKRADQRGGKVLVPVLDAEMFGRIHERAAVRQWWIARQRQRRQQASEGPLGRCLITGSLTPIERTHGSLRGIPFPGAGAKLIAYDKPAFSSYGLDQGSNAPISEAAARQYVAALNHLLARDAVGRRKSAIDLDDTESVVVFWTQDATEWPSKVVDAFDPPATGPDAADAVASVWRGKSSRSVDLTPFYATTLGVNSARVVVRDWFETTAADVQANLLLWFQDLHIGDGEPGPMPLGKLLRAMQATPGARGDKRGLGARLASLVFRAAVQGAPLPRSLLAAAVQRMRVAPREKEDAPFVLRARVAIIKAVLRRRGREVPVALDETNMERAYLLGRLFAALEKLQLVASGLGYNLNATVRDRYYGAASSTPARVFGRLLSLSMHHASKTANQGLGVLAERAKAEIIDRLPAERFPRTLALDEQGLFAVGYYHQRQSFRPKQ